jgi:hypothetical protein
MYRLNTTYTTLILPQSTYRLNMSSMLHSRLLQLLSSIYRLGTMYTTYSMLLQLRSNKYRLDRMYTMYFQLLLSIFQQDTVHTKFQSNNYLVNT